MRELRSADTAEITLYYINSGGKDVFLSVLADGFDALTQIIPEKSS